MYDNIYKINKALTFFRSHKNSQTIKMNKEKNGLINSCYNQGYILVKRIIKNYLQNL